MDLFLVLEYNAKTLALSRSVQWTRQSAVQFNSGSHNFSKGQIVPPPTSPTQLHTETSPSK